MRALAGLEGDVSADADPILEDAGAAVGQWFDAPASVRVAIVPAR